MKYCFLILLLHCFCTFIQAQTPSLTRGPYLQVVTTTGITVRWRTDVPSASRVWFGTAPNALNQSVSDPTLTTEHIVSLTGLLIPATRYYYAIGQGETRLAGDADHIFKTAIPAGDTRPFRIWSLGDFGNGTQNQFDVYEQYKKATANRPADLWVWMGDNAYCCGTEEDYQNYLFNVYGPHLRSLPFYPTPGNHDYADQNQKFDSPYFSVFSFPEQGQAGGLPSGSKMYYSYDYGNVHFVSLDSFGLEAGKWPLYDPTGDQVRWLERDLAANKQPWTVVYFHHPPYTKTARDSDAEEALRLIRENLTPILERYNVDLVMNGHSHTYERTYRIRDHRGLAATFDASQHLAETTTARYDGSPNSCPILTKGKGTVYVVNGSGGALGGAYFSNPDHPAMATTFKTIGGSMVIDVNDNRMDAQFIAADGSIQDRFTIMKNVGQHQSLQLAYGDTLQARASWPADAYRWSEGSQTTRTTRITRRQPGTFTVTATDDRNCLRDEFSVTVSARPRVAISQLASATLCPGQVFDINLSVENTLQADAWEYTVQLSDERGSFDRPQVIGTGRGKRISATLPATISGGGSYSLRAIPRQLPDAELIASAPVTILTLASASIAGSVTVNQGESASVSITFSGNGPWSGTLTNGVTFSAATSVIVLPVNPAQTTTYALAAVRNGCGPGTVTGQAVVRVLVPTATETFSEGTVSVYPNPTAGSVTLDVVLNKPQESEVDVLDVSGRLIQSFTLKASLHQQRTINLPQPGAFSIRLQVGNKMVIRRVIRQ